MRHYVVQKRNQNPLPHTLYMQMLYVVRDYAEKKGSEQGTDRRKKQWAAVDAAKGFLEKTYKKGSGQSGTLDSLQAFFEYPYYSMQFMQKGRELGASKRNWNLYRCRFAYLVAKELGLIGDDSDNRRDE